MLAVTLTLIEAAPIRSITIDGNFADWSSVPSYFDPVAGPGVLHNGIPDTHDTDHSNSNDVPAYVNHPDIDLVEFKFAHDASNLYAYFRATGVIGRTANTSTQRGRYYVIVTLDVDNNDATGYPIHEGGYYPTSTGYDMNMEVEYYTNTFNTGHYLNHGARNQAELNAAIQDQTNGIVRVLPGSYDYYSQWVWFDSPSAGNHRLPPPDSDASITFVADRGPVYQGNIRIARSPDGHEVEMIAPFRGFMRDPAGQPIMALGKTIDLSFSLEASGELAPGNSWASDTGDPIVGYYLSPYTEPELQIAPLTEDDRVVLSWAGGAEGMVLKQSSSLTNPNWQPVSGSDTTNRVFLPIGSGNAFFRLEEP
ncbi:MAG: hypothetical protein KJ070_20010 [Verrucomicrobia bacterium]|nr:hypothetical protein [Verrucomicrobiota bacterium]